MKNWLRIADRIDRFSDRTGSAISWLALIMVLMGAFNAVVRFLDRYTGAGLSSNSMIEAQWYMFSILFLLGAAYTLKHGEHVRVDVLYSRLSPKVRNWINLVGTLGFLFPFCILMIWASLPAVQSSWSNWEKSPDPGGLPRYPIKTLIPLAFFLVMVQGFSEVIKQIARLRGHLPADPDDHFPIPGDAL